LESIPGIGKKTADKLLVKYKSWKKIRLAPEQELIQMVGASKAALIKGQKEREP
jgi:excinuclease ABC subunit C